MRKKTYLVLCLCLIVGISCDINDYDDRKVEIPYFNFPQNFTFEDSLSAYNIFRGIPSNLIPSDDYSLLELNSVLFTDYAYKQRLINVPVDSSISLVNGTNLDYPDGTTLTKTFFYYFDDRDTSLGKRIIETRLLIKDSGKWNVASYKWNDSQTDATLILEGDTSMISWINTEGVTRSTRYQIPSQNSCMTCHQSNSTISPLGSTLPNLNRTVDRGKVKTNQLIYLQSIGLLEQFSIDDIPKMTDYNNLNASLSDRGRAYLAMNCAHCHNPNAWDIPAERDFDFRFGTSFEYTGIQHGKEKILRSIKNQEMPFIGTTLIDKEGVELLIEYLNGL